LREVVPGDLGHIPISPPNAPVANSAAAPLHSASHRRRRFATWPPRNDRRSGDFAHAPEMPGPGVAPLHSAREHANGGARQAHRLQRRRGERGQTMRKRKEATPAAALVGALLALGAACHLDALLGPPGGGGSGGGGAGGGGGGGVGARGPAASVGLVRGDS